MCGDHTQANVHLKEALAVSETTEKQDNKDYLLSELQSIR